MLDIDTDLDGNYFFIRMVDLRKLDKDFLVPPLDTKHAMLSMTSFNYIEENHISALITV
jgi:hypothetical protein